MNPSDPLAQLRDIHLPNAIGAWPPAPGWWLLLALICVTVFFIGRKLQKYYQCRAYRRSAQQQLEKIKRQWQESGDQQRYLSQLAIILRRTALSFYADAAILTGTQWLDFLDASHGQPTSQQKHFSSPLGQLLITEAYRAEPQASPEQLQALHKHCASWIERHQLPVKNRDTRHA